MDSKEELNRNKNWFSILDTDLAHFSQSGYLILWVRFKSLRFLLWDLYERTD
jgi:hypothetical protein